MNPITLKSEGETMTKGNQLRAVSLFMLICFLLSWPIMFCVDAWLEPLFSQQGNVFSARLYVLFGHSLAMLGPAIAALFMWHLYHRESPPPWKWSRPKYYGWVVLAMLAMWTLPGLIGLFFGDTIVSPIETYIWIAIATMLVFGWISGIGEEAGWCAYLLPQLSPKIGMTRAMIVSGAIRGLWHWPVVISPIIGQVIVGERTLLELLGAGVVIAVQLVIGNILFGAVMGWIWYRTESIPLVGWTHFWHNLTRDVTIMLLVGYGGGLWAASLSGFVPVILGFVLLDRVIKAEGLNWWQLFGRAKGQELEELAGADDTGSGTRIRLLRRSAISDKLQAYKILIDGDEVGQIRDGQSISILVSPGPHAVQLRMDWCRSKPVEFSATEGEGIRFECGSSLGGWRIILAVLYITLLRNRYMWIRQLQ
jgi:membrane protease YdiL (CAAX protease family)